MPTEAGYTIVDLAYKFKNQSLQRLLQNDYGLCKESRPTSGLTIKQETTASSEPVDLATFQPKNDRAPESVEETKDSNIDSDPKLDMSNFLNDMEFNKFEDKEILD